MRQLTFWKAEETTFILLSAVALILTIKVIHIMNALVLFVGKIKKKSEKKDGI